MRVKQTADRPGHAGNNHAGKEACAQRAEEGDQDDLRETFRWKRRIDLLVVGTNGFGSLHAWPQVLNEDRAEAIPQQQKGSTAARFFIEDPKHLGSEFGSEANRVEAKESAINNA
ncbi:MAG TPA: hypothetical protein VGB69_12265 [Edaphobacter sp.]